MGAADTHTFLSTSTVTRTVTSSEGISLSSFCCLPREYEYESLYPALIHTYDRVQAYAYLHSFPCVSSSPLMLILNFTVIIYKQHMTREL